MLSKQDGLGRWAGSLKLGWGGAGVLEAGVGAGVTEALN